LERRAFLRSLVGGVAVVAAVLTWPFRVYSFPSSLPLPGYFADCVFVENPMVWYMNVDQAAAFEEVLPRLKYVIRKVDQRSRIITLEAVPQESLTWENLKRSPTPWPRLPS